MNNNWKEEIELIKSIIEKTPLEHAIKWGGDVYTYQGKNVIGIAPFKSYLGIWFYNGVFMSDPKKVFVNAQENKTKALRQWRFASREDIHEGTLLSYLQEAIQNEKDGKKWVPEKTTTVDIPSELANALNGDAAFKRAFEKLSLSKRKDYAEHISTAKKEQTKVDRIVKIKPMILEGKGLHDKYKK